MDRRQGIGILAFAASPREVMLPGRTRALLAEAALQGAELLLFSAADCDPSVDRINAEVFEQGAWRREPRETPKVVHAINGPVREEDRLIEDWLRSRATVFSGVVPDKVEQARLLAASPLAAHVIPWTELKVDGLERQLADWITAHGGAVVKPIDGRQGSKIHFIRRRGGLMELRKDTGPASTGSLDDIVATVCRQITGRMGYRTFIAQPYIESTDQGLPLSLRMDVNKDPHDRWNLTWAIAQLNLEDGLTTNIHGGGMMARIEGPLGRRASSQERNLLDEATRIACGAAEVIDAAGGPCFEFGIDLAIDPEDRLWFLEANGRPAGYGSQHERARRVLAYLIALAARNGPPA